MEIIVEKLIYFFIFCDLLVIGIFLFLNFFIDRTKVCFSKIIYLFAYSFLSIYWVVKFIIGGKKAIHKFITFLEEC